MAKTVEMILIKSDLLLETDFLIILNIVRNLKERLCLYYYKIGIQFHFLKIINT